MFGPLLPDSVGVSYLQLTLPSVYVVCGLVQPLQLALFTVNTQYTAHHMKTDRRKDNQKFICVFA